MQEAGTTPPTKVVSRLIAACNPTIDGKGREGGTACGVLFPFRLLSSFSLLSPLSIVFGILSAIFWFSARSGSTGTKRAYRNSAGCWRSFHFSRVCSL